PNDQDALDSAASGNFLDKILRECLSIIESKLKVRYSRSRVNDVRENENATLSSSSHSNSFDLQQIAAALEDKLDIRMNRFEKSLNEMKISLVTPTAPLKAVTEVCVTCGSNHSYNQRPLTRVGNDFPVLLDLVNSTQSVKALILKATQTQTMQAAIWIEKAHQDHIIKGDIELYFIPTTYELVDIFTEPLDESTFTILKAKL
nr:retrovirus-related Pol polyprotein from transposon TNT 1-94 [Tanacetum cinerariifolium]